VSFVEQKGKTINKLHPFGVVIECERSSYGLTMAHRFRGSEVQRFRRLENLPSNLKVSSDQGQFKGC
jgi:hypothetical protein